MVISFRIHEKLWEFYEYFYKFCNLMLDSWTMWTMPGCFYLFYVSVTLDLSSNFKLTIINPLRSLAVPSGLHPFHNSCCLYTQSSQIVRPSRMICYLATVLTACVTSSELFFASIMFFHTFPCWLSEKSDVIVLTSLSSVCLRITASRVYRLSWNQKSTYLVQR